MRVRLTTFQQHTSPRVSASLYCDFFMICYHLILGVFTNHLYLYSLTHVKASWGQRSCVWKLFGKFGSRESGGFLFFQLCLIIPCMSYHQKNSKVCLLVFHSLGCSILWPGRRHTRDESVQLALVDFCPANSVACICEKAECSILWCVCSTFHVWFISSSIIMRHIKWSFPLMLWFLDLSHNTWVWAWIIEIADNPVSTREAWLPDRRQWICLAGVIKALWQCFADSPSCFCTFDVVVLDAGGGPPGDLCEVGRRKSTTLSLPTSATVGQITGGI